VSRPIRFGVAAHAVLDADEWRRLAQRVEHLGYATLLLPDHTNPQLAPIPALVAAAAATTTLRVGTQVLCNDLRNPVIAAKEVATLDLLSGGRADWGMGAGWLPADYDGSGIPFDPPGVRVRRLREAVELMRALFDGHPVEHRGEFYRSTGVSGTPRPVQRPHPPLLIGGAQERLLRWAGSVADIVSIGPSWQSRQIGPYPPSVGIEEGMDQQVRWVAEGAASAGRALSDLELSVTVMPVVFTDDPGEGFARAGAPHGISAADAERAPYILVGSVEEMAEAIRARHERWGVANWVVPAEVADAFAPVVQRVLAGG
jgi:probable F420-dependent oxidoreductase